MCTCGACVCVKEGEKQGDLTNKKMNKNNNSETLRRIEGERERVFLCEREREWFRVSERAISFYKLFCPVDKLSDIGRREPYNHCREIRRTEPIYSSSSSKSKSKEELT